MTQKQTVTLGVAMIVAPAMFLGYMDAGWTGLAIMAMVATAIGGAFVLAHAACRYLD